MPDDFTAHDPKERDDTITVLGCGEAFDDSLPNTSLLLRADGNVLLMDCGYLVPQRVWKELGNGENLHGIWISHLHADHAMGLPALLTRMWEEGRTEPLAILGQRGTAGKVLGLLEAGYPSMGERLRFPIEEVAVEPPEAIGWRGMELESAETIHGLRNLAVRVSSSRGGVVAYSGDGAPTEESAALGRGAHWFHECFTDRGRIPGHASLEDLLELMPRVAPSSLQIVHVSRRYRDAVAERVRECGERLWPLSLPHPGDIISL